MLALSGTVGGVITRVLPRGGCAAAYFDLITRDNKQEQGDVLADFNGLRKAEKSSCPRQLARMKAFTQAERQLEKLVSSLVEPGEWKRIPKAYRSPPYSMFDAFAVASRLIAAGGVYPHFEPACEGPEECTETRRGLARHIRISPEHRQKTEHIAELLANEFKGYRLTVRPTGETIDQRARRAASAAPTRIEDWAQSDSPFLAIAYLWAVLLRSWDKPAFAILSEGEPAPEWWSAAYDLLCISDMATQGAGFSFRGEPGSHQLENPRVTFWQLLAEMICDWSGGPDGSQDSAAGPGKTADSRYVVSLSIADRNVINVLPKSRTAQVGCTLRSLTHNLAALPPQGAIRVGWFWAQGRRPARIREKRPFNVLVIPYPFELTPNQFEPMATPSSNGARWSTFAPKLTWTADKTSALVELVAELLAEAEQRSGPVHAIVFPELALSAKALQAIIALCEATPSIEVLCAGMHERPHFEGVNRMGTPTNGAAIVTFSLIAERACVHKLAFHEKHHRWKLTEQQIEQYGLSSTLDPSRIWWEDHRTVNRKLPIFVMRDSWTVTALICEDLARNDPARGVVEAIGPNLVLSLVMDGPQIPNRWSARYATVLAEDPGSAVLTINSLGLVERGNAIQPAERRSRAICLWREDTGRTVPIMLGDGALGVCLTLAEFPTVDYSMDGRRGLRPAVSLRLVGQTQIGETLMRRPIIEWGA